VLRTASPDEPTLRIGSAIPVMSPVAIAAPAKADFLPLQYVLSLKEGCSATIRMDGHHRGYALLARRRPVERTTFGSSGVPQRWPLLEASRLASEQKGNLD
jgi:hypothetical protein